MQQAISRRVTMALQHTASLQRVLRARSPMVLWSKNRQRLAYLTQLLQGNMQYALWRMTQRVAHQRGQLELLDHALPVELGYTITYMVRETDKIPIYTCGKLRPGDPLLTRLKDGEVFSTVTAINIRKE